METECEYGLDMIFRQKLTNNVRGRDDDEINWAEHCNGHLILPYKIVMGTKRLYYFEKHT